MNSRNYTWADAKQTAEAGQRMAGIDYLRAMMNGELPRCSYQETMDYDLVEVAEGRDAHDSAMGWKGDKGKIVLDAVKEISRSRKLGSLEAPA